MTKAEAIDLRTRDNVGNSSIEVYESLDTIGWGYPPVYQELWYKILLNASWPAMLLVSVWNMGGDYYQPWPPPDDEWLPPAPAKPGYAYSSIVTVYDQADQVITTGRHVQVNSIDRKGQWIYFKVTQPVYYPYAIVCNSKIRIVIKSTGGAILQGTLMVQDEASNGVIYAMSVGANYGMPRNYIFPEVGHWVGGAYGDNLYNGVSCIIDNKTSAFTVRNKYYRAPNHVPVAVNTQVYNIRRNADGYSSFWISYRETGVNKVRALILGAIPTDQATPISTTWGPVMGITEPVNKLCARANQYLYYTVEGSREVRVWDIEGNKALPLLSNNGGLGEVTDIMVLPDTNVMVGYNNTLNPTTYTVRRYDAVTGAVVRDYVFTSNGAFNRINYGESIDVFYIWTHEASGVSTLRKVNLASGVVQLTTNYREYEAGRLILDQEMYNADGSPGIPIQQSGFTNKFNFWINPTYISPGGFTADFGGPLIIPPSPPPDDEYYPPVITFPPIIPPTYPTLPGETPPPGGVYVPPEVPPYPGYPWLPAPPGSTPIPPAVTALPLKIGGGLIILDPANTTRHDVYLDEQGKELPVAVKVVIRTSLLGD